MATSSEQGAGRRARRHGGRRLLAVGLLVAWLCGRGLGWFGQAPDPTQPAPTSTDRTGVTATTAVPAPADQHELAGGVGDGDALAAAAATAAAPVAEIRPVAGPAVASATVPPVTQPPAPSSQPVAGIDADRFASSLSLVTTRTDDGQFGSALAALQHLRSLPLDGAQLAALAGPSQRLEQALADACASLLQGLCRGEVLAARDDVARLFGDGTVVLPVVEAALRPWQLDGELLRPFVVGEEPLPQAVPLPRNRELRVRWRGVTVGARVVDSRSDQVTVRVRDQAGQAFPTLPVVVCEPVAPSVDEAVEMALAALHANDAVTARLWLAVARQRGDGSLPARGERLAARLR